MKKAAQQQRQEGLSKKQRKIADWALDKMNDMALGGYALFSYDLWMKFAKGTITIPEGGYLVLTSLGILTLWAIIGWLKGNLEGD